MLSFAAAAFFLFITPGPGVMSIAGVGAAYGARAAYSYFLGLLIGSNTVGIIVLTGLAAIMFAVPWLRTVLFVISLGYIAYLGARIALAGAKVRFARLDKAPGFGDGFALQLINPKAYVVNTTFFSGFAFWPENFAGELAIKLIIINAIWIPIHILWLWGGITIRRLDLSERTQKLINIGMALSMLAVVAVAAYAQFGGQTG